MVGCHHVVDDSGSGHRCRWCGGGGSLTVVVAINIDGGVGWWLCPQQRWWGGHVVDLEVVGWWVHVVVEDTEPVSMRDLEKIPKCACVCVCMCACVRVFVYMIISAN